MEGQIQSMLMRELALLNFLRWDALNGATNVSGRVVSQDLRIGARWTARVSIVPLLALHHSCALTKATMLGTHRRQYKLACQGALQTYFYLLSHSLSFRLRHVQLRRGIRREIRKPAC